MRKENKNNNFIQQFVSSASPYSAILENITYVNNVCNVYADNSENILICVPKMNEGLTGLERHEGE